MKVIEDTKDIFEGNENEGFRITQDLTMASREEVDRGTVEPG